MGLMPVAGSVLRNMCWIGEEESHVVQFYGEDSSLIEALGRSLVPVLAGGDSAVVISTLQHRLALSHALEVGGINVSDVTKAGRYVAEDANESLAQFMIDGLPDVARFLAHFGPMLERARTAAERPRSSVFVFGEMVALLWAEGAFESALQLERLWNDLSQTNSFQLRCAYPVGVVCAPEGQTVFLEMCAEHTSVLPANLPTNQKHDSNPGNHAVGDLAFWQQRAQLEVEIAGRKKLRIQMKQSRIKALEEVEVRVAERTAELRETNAQISRRADELDRTNRGLRELSARLLRVQDDERRRIARDLHDGTGQELALLNMSLSSMHNEAQRTNSGFVAELDACSGIVRQVFTELRALCYLLHPPLLDEMGLNSALRWFVDGFGQRTGIQVCLELPENLGRLEPSLEVAIFRVVQECLTNIHRHSGGATASIQVERNGGNVILRISDDGKGIPAAQISLIASAGVPGVGLRGIRERIKDFGGNLDVTSNGKGTQIRVIIPATLAPREEERPKTAA